MNYQYIEQLIERYFLAETRVAEENILHTFFSQSDVPEHLQQYADLFGYALQQQDSDVLGGDFDERVLARLAAQGDAPEVRVKVKRMTFGERIKPLWRAAAAVAIVIVLVGGAGQSVIHHPTSIILNNGDAAAKSITPDETQPGTTPYRQVEEGMKMAVTGDSLSPAKAQ